MLEELSDEIKDFFEDFGEHLGKSPSPKKPKEREVVINGVVTHVRPAYLFAERVDNLLRIVFGVSIIISAATSTFLGFQTLSGLLQVLINTYWGRVIMAVIGFSYFIIAVWKLLHLKTKQ